MVRPGTIARSHTRLQEEPMKQRSRRTTLGLFGATAALCCLSASLVGGQAPTPAQPVAESVFKNIQVMKGVPADELMASMGLISNALAVNCTYCHLGDGGGGWGEYARDNDKKMMARVMIRMVSGINQTYFGGRQVVTCVSCHNGANRPKSTSNMAAYYGLPLSDDPDDIVRQAVGAPTPDQVLDKYIQALGGAQRIAALTSFVGKGTHMGYGDADMAPMQVFAKAPNQYSEVLTTGSGTITKTFDGRLGWSSVPDAFTPLPLRALKGAELEGARLDAMLAFPTQIRQALTNWRGSVPSAIGDEDVQVIQGTMANGFPVKLYFSDESGLLVRQIRHIEAALGRATWQLDYADYRDVAGVKIPFKRTLSWQSGQTAVQLSDVQANVPVDAARFGRPAAPVPAR